MKVVVGIDQSSTASGFAAVAQCRPVCWGLARDVFGQQAAIARIAELARGDLAEVLWVFEGHGDMGILEGHSNSTPHGLGVALGRWLGQLELLRVTDSRILQVPPTTWRRAVLKRCRPGQDWKSRALEYVATLPGCKDVVDHNVAEALCIAMWGAFAGTARREQKRVATNYLARERRRRQGATGPAGEQLVLGGKESA